jgi:ABC-type phosphate/phosphonate transport system ATPase subunit
VMEIAEKDNVAHWQITASYRQKPRYNVLLLGISGSGKSAWLDKVRSQVTKTSSRSLGRFHPTVGQNGELTTRYARGVRAKSEST